MTEEQEKRCKPDGWLCAICNTDIRPLLDDEQNHKAYMFENGEVACKKEHAKIFAGKSEPQLYWVMRRAL